MSNEATTHFGVEAYHGKVNIKLFNDIVAFIAGTTPDKPTTVLSKSKKSHLWYDNSKTESIQQQFGFRYLGELLERYEERVSGDIADTRAIALALAFAKDLLSEDMFVGRQKNNFIRKITSLAKSDLYLKGALYQLNKGETDVQGLADELMQMEYTNTEELIFAVSLFSDFEQTLAGLMPQLVRLLGLERTITVSGNTNLFCWLIRRFRRNANAKVMRKKDAALFRALVELPVAFVKEGNRNHNVLLESGYSANDIIYLNSIAIRYRPTKDTLDANSIVAEKIAVEMCLSHINSENEHPTDVYEHLKWLLEKYDSFTIKIGGYEGIYQFIKNSIRLANPHTFLWLHKLTKNQRYRGEPVLSDAIFRFDILDEKWNPLCEGLDTETYRELFDSCLVRNHSDASTGLIMEMIERYESLSGLSYLEFFNKDYSWQNNSIFSLLVEKGIVNLMTVFDACDEINYVSVDTSYEGRPNILHYITSYIKGLHSREAFEFFRDFLSRYGFNGMNRLLVSSMYRNRDDFFGDTFYKGPGRYHAGYSKQWFDVKRSFLTDDEHRELLGWLDDYMFLFRADDYIDFSIQMLEDAFIPSLYSQEEMRRIYDEVKGLDKVKNAQYTANSLKEKYLTAAELQADKKAEKAQAAKQKQIEHEAERQKLRREIENTYDGTFKAIHNFVHTYRFSSSKEAFAYNIGVEYFAKALRDSEYTLGKDEMAYCLRVGAFLVRKNAMTYNSFKNYIFMLEESEVSVDVKDE